MDKKKIILVGSDHQAALELIFKRELISFGYSVLIFPAQTVFLNFYNASVFNKILYRLGLSSIIQKIQKDLRAFIVKNKPTIVLIFKGMEITPETLLWIRNKDIKIYNFNPDHPFIFSGSGSGNTNVSNSIALYDYYFSYADDAVKCLAKLGVKSEKIPFGFDSNGFEFKELTKDKEVLKMCFVGNPDKYRAQFINQLASFGLEIDVYGDNWHKFSMIKEVTIFSAKYGSDFWTTLQIYAIQINLLRPHNFATHNMRSFDIPGSGGIMLAPYTNDHSSYFENGVEVFLFIDLLEASEICRKLLSLTFEERQVIRIKAREKSINKHSYSIRIRQFLNYL